MAPRAANPIAAPTMPCSAMNISKKRSGATFSNRSLKVEFLTSASSPTMRVSSLPTAASAVPRILAFNRRQAFALDGPGDQHRRLARRGARHLEALLDVGDVVAVDDDGLPAEGVPSRGDPIEVVPELGGLAL